MDKITLANELKGNWKKFNSFCWSDSPDDSENWGIVYTHNRDSGHLDEQGLKS